MMSNWQSKDRVHKVRNDAKFNVSLLKIAQNLVALGFTEKDLGVVLGCSDETISSWKKRYPDFFDACKNGKKILKGILVAEMMRAAIGYDYEEIDEIYRVEKNSEGKELKVLSKVNKHTKHQPGNAALQQFLAQNLLPDDFPRSPIILEQNNIGLLGTIEQDKIKEFAGHLLETMNRKQIESKVIDEPVVRTEQSVESNSEGCSTEHPVQV